MPKARAPLLVLPFFILSVGVSVGTAVVTAVRAIKRQGTTQKSCDRPREVVVCEVRRGEREVRLKKPSL